MLECRRKLYILSERNKVTFVWIPGHAGISGNQEADQLVGLEVHLDFNFAIIFFAPNKMFFF